MSETQQAGHSAVAGQVDRPVRHQRGDVTKTYKRNGVTCWECLNCDRVHALGVYVFAHWDDELTHTCECGHKHTVLRGEVKYLGA